MIKRTVGSPVRPYLVVVRAGDHSLHPSWTTGGNRNWDLAVSYYGEKANPFPGDVEFLHRAKGSKWEGLSDFFNQFMESVMKYEYVWLPDDDLATTSENIDQFFKICSQASFNVAQPALEIGSFYSHKITVVDRRALYRLTNFVEIMAPCFKVSSINTFIPTFDLNSSGWGLEWVWWHLASQVGSNNFAIVDKCTVLHTRQVGSAGHGGGTFPQVEALSLLNELELISSQPKVLERIIDPDYSIRSRFRDFIKTNHMHLNSKRRTK